MEQANGYISESKGDTLSTASHQSNKKSQLSRKESLAQEHIRRITKEVKQKQIKLINSQKELEDKYKSERAQLEQEFADQRRISEETNNNAQKCYDWLENETDNESEEDHLEQNSVSNDGTIHKKLSADAPPFHPHHEKNEAIKIDKKAEKIGQDLWKQLKRVPIPIFYGEKKMYENWKAAFAACIDQAPAPEEYKLLQLRQYPSGEALKAIEGLGHSAFAYQAAKEILERKYGGTRRKVMVYLNAIANFKPIREDHPKEVEQFEDLLDIAVTNLEEAKRTEELGNRTLYHKLQRKITEPMLRRYKRWVHKQRRNENVEKIRAFIIEEAEFEMAAAETNQGFQKVNVSRQKNVGNIILFGSDRNMTMYYFQRGRYKSSMGNCKEAKAMFSMLGKQSSLKSMRK